MSDKQDRDNLENENDFIDSLEEECIQDVLEQKEREEEEEEEEEEEGRISHDVFESGVIWTQVGSTQVHRNAWLRGGGHHNSQDDEFKPINIDGKANVQQNDSIDDPLDDLQCTGISVDDSHSIHQLPSSSIRQEDNPETQNGQPAWWEKGKTAPLLNEYDDRRRMWYMAQAGVYDESDSIHDAQARQPILVQDSVIDLQSSPPRRIPPQQERDPSSSPPIIVEHTPARTIKASEVSNSIANVSIQSTAGPSRPNPLINTPTANANITNTPSTASFFQRRTNSSSFTPQRATLSLAGNLNTPISQNNNYTNNNNTPSSIQTPKRKTWESTWALREQNSNTSSSGGGGRGKKRKRGGGGGGGNTPRGGRKSNNRGAVSPNR